MTDSTVHDLVILGGGSGGYACALRAAQLGLSVVLIEKDKLGGTCLHQGCIPTKALLHAAEVADAAKDSAPVRGQGDLRRHRHAGGQHLQGRRRLPALQGPDRSGEEPRRHATSRARAGSSDRTPSQVGDTVYRGRHVVLATGSVPKSLPGLEIDGARVITSDHALQLDYVPRSAVVLGGGVIGVEFASVWRSFGADVTIVEALPHLVPAEDEALSKQLERAVPQARHRLRARRARSPGWSTPRPASSVTLENGKTLEADLLLVAVGRGPVSAGLGYEEAGVAMDRGFVLVDEHCRTNVPNVFAVGDLIPTLQLAHVGFAEGILVAEQIAGLDAAADRLRTAFPASPTPSPRSPRWGSPRPRPGTGTATPSPPSSTTSPGTARARSSRRPDMVKLVAVTDGPVVGVHLVGSRVGELLAEGQLIYNWEAYADDVRRSPPCPPDAVRGHGRGPPRARGQAAARPFVTPDPKRRDNT